MNIIFFLTFIVFLNQKDEIFEYLEKNENLRKKFFEIISTNKMESTNFDQNLKLNEIHELLENDTNDNEILTIQNFGGKVI